MQSSSGTISLAVPDSIKQKAKVINSEAGLPLLSVPAPAPASVYPGNRARVIPVYDPTHTKTEPGITCLEIFLGGDIHFFFLTSMLVHVNCI